MTCHAITHIIRYEVYDIISNNEGYSMTRHAEERRNKILNTNPNINLY